jgi:hypothetical protein
MPDPKRVKLLVEMNDPGEWCYRYAAPYGQDICNLWSDEAGNCSANFVPEGTVDGYRRPESCKAAEVKP